VSITFVFARVSIGKLGLEAKWFDPGHGKRLGCWRWYTKQQGSIGLEGSNIVPGFTSRVVNALIQESEEENVQMSSWFPVYLQKETAAASRTHDYSE
jgi:hypothetical protein